MRWIRWWRICRRRTPYQLPNPKPSKPKVNWARIDLTTDKVDFEMATPLKAALKASAIQLEAGNVLSKDPVLYAAVGLQSERPVEVEMDSMGGTIDAPNLKAIRRVQHQGHRPSGESAGKHRLRRLDGFFKDIKADLKASQLEVGHGGRKDKSARAESQTQTRHSMHKWAKNWMPRPVNWLWKPQHAITKGENDLLKWNPRLKINLKNGVLNIPERLPETVYIPSIEFKYSNREMTIDNSRIELGNSDLNLKGNVRHIGKWFRHKDILEGELDIVSDHCDANQLLAWFSADKAKKRVLRQIRQMTKW